MPTVGSLNSGRQKPQLRLIPSPIHGQDEAADLGIPGHFPQLNLSSKPPHQLHAVHLNLLLGSVDLCRAVDLARVKTMVAKRQKTGYRTQVGIPRELRRDHPVKHSVFYLSRVRHERSIPMPWIEWIDPPAPVPFRRPSHSPTLRYRPS